MKTRKTAYITLGVLGSLLALLLIVPFFINLNNYRPKISQRVSEALGRQVELAGDISLSILPMPHVSVNDIRVANIPGGSEKYFAQLKNASAWIELWPLLHRKVNIRAVSLDGLNVQLEKLKNDQNNWGFKIESSREPSKFDIRLNEVRLSNSALSYLAAGKKTRVKDIDVQVTLGSLGGPYHVKGSLEAMGEPLDFDINAERPTPHSAHITQSSIELRQTLIRINATLDWQNMIQASLGLVLPGGSKANLSANQTAGGWAGRFNLDSSKPSALIQWASGGKKIDSELLNKPLHIQANFAYSEQLSLNNLLATLGTIKTQGNISLLPGASGNLVTLAPLQVSGLELKNPMIAGPITLSGTVKNMGKQTNFDPFKIQFASGLIASGKISADLSDSKPRIHANINTSPITLPTSPESNSKERWSKEVIDLSVLEKYEGQFDVAIPKLTRGTLAFDNLRVHAMLQNNTLSIAPLTAGVYGGDLDVRASASSKGAITLKTTLNNAQLNAIAPNESKLKVVAGVLNVSTDLKTTGLNANDWVSHLDGPVSIRTRNGRISGFDLDALIDRLSNLNGPEAFLNLFTTYMAKGSTAFNTYNGDVVFTQGVGKIQNMTLATNRAQGSATGWVNLPPYTMDINAKLQITNPAGLPSFGAHLYGSIEEPKRDFDTDALKVYVLKNLTRGVIQNITNRQIPNLFNRLLGH